MGPFVSLISGLLTLLEPGSPLISRLLLVMDLRRQQGQQQQQQQQQQGGDGGLRNGP